MRAVGVFLLVLVFGTAAHAQCTVSGSAGELVYNSGSGGGCLSSSATVTSAGALTLPATGTGLSVTGNATFGTTTNGEFSLQPPTSPGTPVLATLGPTGAVGLNINLQNASGGADGLLKVLNPVEIVPSTFAWSGAYQPAFFESVSLTGTATGSSAYINQYNITENVNASAPTSLTDMYILHYYGGGTTEGGRAAFQASLVQQNGANTDSGVSNFYVGAAFYSIGEYSQPGSTTATPLGNIVGLNAVGKLQENTGGTYPTNVLSLNGFEADVNAATGSTYALRSIINFADVASGSQGFWGDTMAWFYMAPAGASTPYRYGELFGGTQPYPISSTGTIIGASEQGSSYASIQLAAKWGMDFQQVIFPSSGNPYDGGLIRGAMFAVDGAGTINTGSCYQTWSASGEAYDCKGSVGSGVSINTPGSGYTPGTDAVVVQEYGGTWLVSVNASGVPYAVTVLPGNEPQWPNTSTPPATATPTSLNPKETGTGLVLNLTWNTTATTLALQPSGGATTVGGALTAVSYRVGSTAGVSCSGAPTASFAVTNGIVTHC